MNRVDPAARQPGTLVGCALDVETTGLDFATDQVIELALQRFWFDGHGRILETGRSRSWREDPGTSLSRKVIELTGLTDGILKGRCISDGEAACLIATSDMVVAHNAAFDRPFVERRLPDAAGGRWMCSMRDLDWPALGFEGRSLSHLASQCGWFYDAHRADVDVTALLHLLDHTLASGETVLHRLIHSAARPSWMIEAVDAPFSAKDALKTRGYRWDGARRRWCREIGPDELDDELKWHASAVYHGHGRPIFRQMTWTERYAKAS